MIHPVNISDLIPNALLIRLKSKSPPDVSRALSEVNIIIKKENAIDPFLGKLPEALNELFKNPNNLIVKSTAEVCLGLCRLGASSSNFIQTILPGVLSYLSLATKSPIHKPSMDNLLKVIVKQVDINIVLDLLVDNNSYHTAGVFSWLGDQLEGYDKGVSLHLDRFIPRLLPCLLKVDTSLQKVAPKTIKVVLGHCDPGRLFESLKTYDIESKSSIMDSLKIDRTSFNRDVFDTYVNATFKDGHRAIQQDLSFKDDHQNEVVKWNTSFPTEDMMDQLKIQMKTCFNDDLLEMLFSFEPTQRMNSFEILTILVQFQPFPILNCLDLILKYVSSSSTHPNKAINKRATDLLLTLLDNLSERGHNLEDNESGLVVRIIVQNIYDSDEYQMLTLPLIMTRLRNSANISRHLLTHLSDENIFVKLFCLKELEAHLRVDAAGWIDIIQHIGGLILHADSRVSYLSLFISTQIYVLKGSKFSENVDDEVTEMIEERMKMMACDDIVLLNTEKINRISSILNNLPSSDYQECFETLKSFIGDLTSLKCLSFQLFIHMLDNPDAFSKLALDLCQFKFESLSFNEVIFNIVKHHLFILKEFDSQQEIQLEEENPIRINMIQILKLISNFHSKINEELIMLCLLEVINKSTKNLIEAACYFIDLIGSKLTSNNFNKFLSMLEGTTPKIAEQIHFLQHKRKSEDDRKMIFLTAEIKTDCSGKTSLIDIIATHIQNNTPLADAIKGNRASRVSDDCLLMYLNLNLSEKKKFTKVLNCSPTICAEDRGGSFILSPDLKQVLTIEGSVHRKIGPPKGQYDFSDLSLEMTSKRETLEEGLFYIGDKFNPNHFVDVVRKENQRRFRFYFIIAESKKLKPFKSTSDVTKQE